MSNKRIKINSIQIKNFRSIRNENIVSNDFNIFVGLNDAGKSNVLKALNLFFNNETDYGKSFSFKTDFTYLFPPKSHSTKEITIKITFDIPETYSESGIYTWKKTWRTGDYFREEITNSEGKFPSPKSRVPGALRRIKYRYVPAVKSQEYYKTMLGELYAALFSSLNNPLEDSVKSFSASLRNYTETLSANIKQQLNLESKLSFPDDLNEIFKALVFETNGEDNSLHVPLTARGDGIQARHIPIVLKYIAQEDQKSRNKGSMKVCTIWGFEEPENGLELSMAFKMADEFDSYANDIQIFITTHSPAFYMKKVKANSRVFFVSKKVGSDETSIQAGKKPNSIAQDMGLMPLVAPFIEKQSEFLRKAEDIYSRNILTDVATIMVEGETDVDYLKFAIAEHSIKLNEMIKNNKLRIICKNDGAGTTQLIDWAYAWIYSGFRSKMMILLDKDEAGINARNIIVNSEIYKTKQSNISMKIQLLEPSDEVIYLLEKHINLPYEIEHLLSTKFWSKIKDSGFAEMRSSEELQNSFKNLVPRNKTLDNVIDDLVEDVSIRDSILSFNPANLKKKKIVNLLNKYDDKSSATLGLVRTIRKIEEYFA
ncbi:MAG: ATP-dependent nuclease [Eubacterium sp.]